MSLIVVRNPAIILPKFENVNGGDCNWTMLIHRQMADHVEEAELLFCMHWGAKDVPTHTSKANMLEFIRAIDQLKNEA